MDIADNDSVLSEIRESDSPTRSVRTASARPAAQERVRSNLAGASAAAHGAEPGGDDDPPVDYDDEEAEWVALLEEQHELRARRRHIQLVALREKLEQERQMTAALERGSVVAPPQPEIDSTLPTASFQHAARTRSPTRKPSSIRPKCNNPTKFKGNTLKEATIFLSELETVFELSKDEWTTERERVLFASTFLDKEPSEQWHFTPGHLDFTYDQFVAFVNNCVADPINRTFDIGLQYEKARQKDNQTIDVFARELATLESQLPEDDYTEAQRTRHLLNKLNPTLRKEITIKGDLPRSRDALVSLGRRIESASGQSNKQFNAQSSSSSNKTQQNSKKSHTSSGQQADSSRGPQQSKGGKSSYSGNNKSKGSPSGIPSHIRCNICSANHYANTCPQRPSAQAGKDKQHAVRQVDASGSQESGKGKGNKKKDST